MEAAHNAKVRFEVRGMVDVTIKFAYGWSLANLLERKDGSFAIKKGRLIHWYYDKDGEGNQVVMENVVGDFEGPLGQHLNVSNLTALSN